MGAQQQEGCLGDIRRSFAGLAGELDRWVLTVGDAKVALAEVVSLKNAAAVLEGRLARRVADHAEDGNPAGHADDAGPVDVADAADDADSGEDVADDGAEVDGSTDTTPGSQQQRHPTPDPHAPPPAGEEDVHAQLFAD